MKRCAWAESSNEMREYHDNEWGKPSHDDAYLFELLILEGAQAGLSWSTVLAKREHYRAALDGFDYTRISRYTDKRVEKLMLNAGLVRNRLKLTSLAINAKAFIEVQQEFGSFDTYLWDWVSGKPIRHKLTAADAVPATDSLSDTLSKDLKRRGFKFVGSTIVYAYLQAVGVIDDHVQGCIAR